MGFNPLNWLMGLFSLDIGIDLGTANTLVYVKGKGIIINEPSWVAIEKRSRKPVAIGAQAKEMAGRVPSTLQVVRPLRDGVISEFEITQAMLEYFIARAHQHTIAPFPRPRIVVGIPSGATDVERRAVYDAAMAAGAREVYLIEEPKATAIGIGLPIADIRGTMVIDIGGGTTEIAILSMNQIVVSRSLRVAGDEIDQEIVSYIRNRYNLAIGERMGEQIKIAIGSVFPLPNERTMNVRGRNLVTGLPEEIVVSSVEIRSAIASCIQVIIDTVRDTIDEAPPELVSDLIETGICVSGGGSQILGVADRLRSDLSIRVWVADEPLTCVARGAGMVFELGNDLSLYTTGLDRFSKR